VNASIRAMAASIAPRVCRAEGAVRTRIDLYFARLRWESGRAVNQSGDFLGSGIHGSYQGTKNHLGSCHRGQHFIGGAYEAIFEAPFSPPSRAFSSGPVRGQPAPRDHIS